MERFKELTKKSGGSDDSAIARSYQRYTKAQRLDPTLSAEKFIEGEVLPTGYISLTALLNQIENPLSNGLDRLRKFATSIGCEVVDTLSGFAVRAEAASQILGAIRESVAIRSIWQKYCEANGLPTSVADYQAFLRLVECSSIKKYRFHPCFLETEYLVGSEDEVGQVVTLLYANESVSKPLSFLRPIRAAERLGVTKSKLEEWFAAHPEQTTSIAGVSFIEAERLANLETQWACYKDITAVDWFGYEGVFDATSYSSFQRRTTELFRTVLSHFLLLPSTFPQQKARKDYVDAKLLKQIEELLSQQHLVPFSALSGLPNISEQHIRSLTRSKSIDAVGEGKNIFLTPDQYAEIVLLATNNVPLKEIVTQMLLEVPSKFKSTKKGCWRDLLDHCHSANWWGVQHGENQLFSASLPHYIANVDVADFTMHLGPWLMAYGLSDAETFALQLDLHRKDYPSAVKALEKAFSDDSVRTKAVSEMADMLFYLLCNSGKDLSDFAKGEFAHLVDNVRAECSIAASHACVELLSANGYFTPSAVEFKRIGEEKDVSAYSVDAFVTIAGAICSREVWGELHLLEKATENRVFAQLWLFVAVHVFAALRTTDYARLEGPALAQSPEEVLEMIRNGTYPEEEARRTCVMFESLNMFRNMRPHKTEKYKNVLPIYFHVPRDLEVEFGLILTVAMAHYELSGRVGNLIVSRVEQNQQTAFFGPTFAAACGNKAFSGRRMNKALMTLVSMAAEEELGLAPDIAYSIASALRSHKGNYASLSETTYRYVGNSPLTELNTEDTLKQLFRRGSCSFILDSMLRKCQGEDYSDLPIHLQTEAIVALGMSPHEVTSLATATKRAMIEAEHTVLELVEGESEMADALHRLLAKDAMSKDGVSECLAKAVGKPCVREAYQGCMGCPYEIRNKAQYIQYFAECCRQHEEIKRCRAEIEQLEIECGVTFCDARKRTILEEIAVLRKCIEKASYVRDQVVLPCLREIAAHIQCLPNVDSRESFKRIKENLERAKEGV